MTPPRYRLPKCSPPRTPKKEIPILPLEQLANKIFGIVGGISTGLLLAVFGGVGAFTAMAVTYFLSALLLVAIPRFAPGAGAFREPPPAHTNSGDSGPGMWASIGHLLRTPAVLVFAIVALSAEVFAYSSEVLAPSFARDILQVGEQGLGNLVAARNAGAVVGVLLLGSVANRVRPDRLLPMICVGFGLGLAAFSFSTSYLLSLMLIGMVGIAWGSVDALLPTLLQQNVDNSKRGAVVGVWNLSRGFGPLGQLEIGALAATIGVAGRAPSVSAQSRGDYGALPMSLIRWEMRATTMRSRPSGSSLWAAHCPCSKFGACSLSRGPRAASGGFSYQPAKYEYGP